MQVFVQVGPSWWTQAVVGTLNVRYTRRPHRLRGLTPTARTEKELPGAPCDKRLCADHIARLVIRTFVLRWS